MNITKAFTAFANGTSRVTGRPLTFVVCIVLILIWAATGPMFQYSDTWQLIINTSTTIITFLMVFLIQNTQNRDNAALQAKLDELIRVTSAKNGFIGIEKLTDKELEQILVDFEKHEEPLSIGERSAIINAKATQVRERKSARAATRNAAVEATPAKASPANAGAPPKPAKPKPAKPQAAPRRKAS